MLYLKAGRNLKGGGEWEEETKTPVDLKVIALEFQLRKD